MVQYFYTLCALSVFVAIIELLVPEGHGEKLKKLISFIGALCIILTMIAPVLTLFENESDLIKKPSIKDEDRTDENALYYATAVGEGLCSIYGEEPSDVRAVVESNEEGEIVKVILKVKSKKSYGEKEAGEVLSEIYGVETEVRKE